MQKKIQSALISVFYKDGLEKIIAQLQKQGVSIYSTGGTQDFIEKLGVKCIPVESLTGYPSILGGRVKTLHPSVFGGILAKRNDDTHLKEMKEFNIPEMDLVIVDLYPFEETVKSTTDENLIIEKIDIGGPSMIRAAAKNHRDVVVVAAKNDYALLVNILEEQNGETSLEQRRMFAIKAFDVCTAYDTAISSYFNSIHIETPFHKEKNTLRYGENPHQPASFFGNLGEVFAQLNGKELSYNNLVDVDAAINLIKEFKTSAVEPGFQVFPTGVPIAIGMEGAVFAIIKHTNVCGMAAKASVKEAWDAALAGDPESAFGGVLICNKEIDIATATAINEIFFEVLIAPSFHEEALQILKSKKNRIVLQLKEWELPKAQYKSLLNGILLQQNDEGNYTDWKEAGGRATTESEKSDLKFANIICKHLKSNAIALIKNKQLIGKGCGQTSRIDSLRQALEKAKQFNVELEDAVLASDAFFPFDDCVKIAHAAGIKAYIQPGGSIRDADSIEYCKQNNLAMVVTGMRHFKH
ncbi:MAG: bifunctional phosphoribosylaminoimidazolecarboxamide formyltransferase/IMP cyclohydrolase [Gloeobacteraceae cyanobacterium ES-bin-316]|nr:bifunctional phosphoribosylaminoimidazolecarboxamide formyltransferase/IMP cyclohydrolase [Ferruginibacter sp.]